MHWSNHCSVLLTSIVTCILHIADGCGRTPARTKPYPTTTVSPYPTTTLQSTPRPSHRKSCTEEEVQQAACLHGGDCFALELGGEGKRSAHCHCTGMWTGHRCEMINEDYFVWSGDTVTQAGIAAGVVAVIIILTVIIAFLVVKQIKRMKEQEDARLRCSKDANGSVSTNLIDREKQNALDEAGYFSDKSETKV